jgi:hypothetical protein
MNGATAPSRQAAETITSAAMRWCRFDPNQEPKHGLNLTIPRAATAYLEQRLSIDFQASDRQIGTDVLRWHQSGIVTKRLDPATEMMRPNTGFHANQTGRQVGNPSLYLATRPLLAQHYSAALIETNNVEYVLTDIDANYGNCTLGLLEHGALLVFGAPSQLGIMASATTIQV